MIRPLEKIFLKNCFLPKKKLLVAASVAATIHFHPKVEIKIRKPCSYFKTFFAKIGCQQFCLNVVSMVLNSIHQSNLLCPTTVGP